MRDFSERMGCEFDSASRFFTMDSDSLINRQGSLTAQLWSGQPDICGIGRGFVGRKAAPEVRGTDKLYNPYNDFHLLLVIDSNFLLLTISFPFGRSHSSTQST